MLQVTLLREYAQGPHDMVYCLPTGGYDPSKHRSVEDCAAQELAEEVPPPTPLTDLYLYRRMFCSRLVWKGENSCASYLPIILAFQRSNGVPTGSLRFSSSTPECISRGSCPKTDRLRVGRCRPSTTRSRRIHPGASGRSSKSRYIYCLSACLDPPNGFGHTQGYVTIRSGTPSDDCDVLLGFRQATGTGLSLREITEGLTINQLRLSRPFHLRHLQSSLPLRRLARFCRQQNVHEASDRDLLLTKWM